MTDSKNTGAKAKAKEPELQDVGGKAVATVSVPARKQQVVIAQSAIEGCAVAAIEAWDKVRGADDATFAMAHPDFKRTLINHAESVYTTGRTLDGDTALARFERQVAKIKGAQDEARKKAAAKESK